VTLRARLGAEVCLLQTHDNGLRSQWKMLKTVLKTNLAQLRSLAHKATVSEPLDSCIFIRTNPEEEENILPLA
jgi:hypothetical protein